MIRPLSEPLRRAFTVGVNGYRDIPAMLPMCFSDVATVNGQVIVV
jgi:hypothetical protein